MTARNAFHSQLADPTLLANQAFTAGAWLSDAFDHGTFDIRNPATGAVIATLPDWDIEKTRLAIGAAYIAQKD